MKYGFVYIWRDRKHKRYYIGRHWGFENDGYICSSKMMRQSYNRRPNDFKRRIILKVDCKLKLISEEQKFLNMIKKEELGIKYYNKSKNAIGPSMFGLKHSEETRRKISKGNLGKKLTEETKNKLKIVNLGKKHSEETKKKMRENHNRDYSDSVFLEKMSFSAKNRSTETKKKISLNSSRLIKEGKIGMLGKTHSNNTKEKMRNSVLNREKIKCPHCDVMGIKANMIRWHFNNCKIINN